jgi:hypothetical protein
MRGRRLSTVTKALPALAAAALLATGCAGGRPVPAQVKLSARDWAQQHLSPHKLEVTLVVVTPDETRARVRLKADQRTYDLRLGYADGSWRVTRARPHAA